MATKHYARLGLLLGLALIPTGRGQSVLLTTGSTPSAGDTLIEEPNPSKKYSGEKVLVVKRAPRAIRISYLKFDTSGLTPGAIADAKAQIVLQGFQNPGQSGPATVNLWAIHDGLPDEEIVIGATESPHELTWNTRVAVSPTGEIDTSKAILVGSFRITEGMKSGTSLALQSEALVRVLKEDTNKKVVFMLDADGSAGSVDGIYFRSSENPLGGGPSLEIVGPAGTSALPSATPPKPAKPSPSEPIAKLIGAPFWHAQVVTNEPLLFIKKPGSPAPSATLLFKPEKILSFKNGTLEIAYEEGRDYLIKPGSSTITLPPGSRIPFKTLDELHPPLGSPQSYAGSRSRGTGIYYDEHGLYQTIQAAVTYYYVEQEWKGYRPKPQPAVLARSFAKLGNRAGLRIVVLGDSVSKGRNATGYISSPPFLPSYSSIVADQLRLRSAAPVELVNLSQGGTTADWGATQVPEILNNAPDLVILAFGVNDGSARVTPPRFANNIQKIIHGVRSARPETDFILVSPFPANPDWTKAAGDLYPQYSRELERLCGPGIALADLSALGDELLKIKNFYDLTGSGINHPNDFIHAQYAHVILSLLDTR